MDATRHLFCTGDPILDIYCFGKRDVENRFETERIVRNHGGALNVWKNIEAIIGSDHVTFINPVQGYSPLILNDTLNFYAIYRFIDESGLIIEGSPCPKKLKSTYYSKQVADSCGKLLWAHQDKDMVERTGLVIAEYNKGAFNENPALNANYLPEYDFCIIDTRYRSINLDLIKTSKVKIWHATGKEYDVEFAKNFNYTLHTDGQSPVKIYDTDSNEIAQENSKLTVPNTPIVNTCGAGDTFTAAVACFLLSKDRVSLTSLIDAAEFGIKCCQDVITTQCTSATRISLE